MSTLEMFHDIQNRVLEGGSAKKGVLPVQLQRWQAMRSKNPQLSNEQLKAKYRQEYKVQTPE